MFRVKETDVTPRFTVASWVVRVTLVLALLANFASAYLIFEEHRLLSTWLAEPESVPPTGLRMLYTRVNLQIISELVVSAIMIFSMVALWWLQRRYFFSQKSLRKLKMLAHDILASMDQGVITTDLHGEVTSINSAGIRLLGADLACVGRPLAGISSTEVPLASLHKQVLEKQAAVRDRDFSVHRLGRVQRLRAEAHVLTDTEGTALGCVIHLRDVTERALMEDRMRRMERFISLGALASGLHHEIKNPLTALSIHIQLLEERLTSPTSGESVDELVGILKSEVVRLNGVLESFRNFANLQHLSVQPTDVSGLLGEAVRLIRPQASQQKVDIQLLQPDQALPHVPLDAEKFEQAILNLMINALEAMPDGGCLSLRTSIQDGEFRVDISDTGPGIPVEIQRNLFEPYFSTKSTGTGMGLALSEKLISQHGGHIDYHTGPEGTTFGICVPLD